MSEFAKDYPGGFIDGAAGGTPITSGVMNNIENNEDAEDVRDPTSEASTDLAARYGTDVRAWAPNTVYAAGQAVVSPTGDLVTAKTAHTSGTTFSGTGASGNWALALPSFVPKWQPLTIYTAGQQVISPNGDVVSAVTSFTSGASYVAANWNLSTSFVAFDAGMSAITTGLSGNLHNVAVGAGALAQSAAGINQVAIGYQALHVAVDNGTGIQNGSNIAVGAYALQNSISNQNVAVGTQALQNLVGDTNNGISNNAFGDEALLNLISGNNNNAFGTLAMANTTGANNCAFGHEALQTQTTGASNSAFGYLAGQALTTGNLNTIVGQSAAYQGTGVVSALTTGSSNVFVGSGAGIGGASQPSNSTAVGKGTLVGASLATAIGSLANANASGAIAIGVDSAGTGAVSSTPNLAVIGTSLHTVQVANLSISNAASTTTAPGAGGAGALPATPAAYISVTINGTARKIPVY